MTLPDEPEVQAHDHCSIDCPCGHWNEYRRRATTRADGRRGKITLDVVEDNDDGSR